VVHELLQLHDFSFALDAACASSLYALKLACHALNAGIVDSMLAGAVSAADPFFIHSGFSLLQAFPEGDGASRPLDAQSQGLYASEGAGMVVLKRLADAQREGDTIHAVLRGSGWSNDGRGRFVLSPNPAGQLRAYERAYTDAHIAPSEVEYLECHATGTPLGDRVEAASMQQFFGEALPRLGSVKSNMGHMLTAAGMSSLFKVVLAMRHHEIPPTIHVSQPLVPEEKLIREPTPWPQNRAVKTATISSFGFGGTNAHLIVQSAPPSDAPVPSRPEEEEPTSQRSSQQLVISGFDGLFGGCADRTQMRDALQQQISQLRDLPQHRWRGLSESAPLGAYLASFTIDLRRFRLPPHPQEQLIPQQLLALHVAENAIWDAAVPDGSHTAVLVALETEPELHQFRGRLHLEQQLKEALATQLPEWSALATQEVVQAAYDAWSQPESVNSFTSTIGNLIASRIASLHDFHGPAFTISAGAKSVAQCLATADLLLRREPLDAVVVVAVDLNASCEAHLNSPGTLRGEGAGALVLQPEANAQAKAYLGLNELRIHEESAALFGDCGAAQGMLSRLAGLLLDERLRRPVEALPSTTSERPLWKVVTLGGAAIQDSRLLPAHSDSGPSLSSPSLPFSLFPDGALHRAHSAFLSYRQQGLRSIAQTLTPPSAPSALLEVTTPLRSVPAIADQTPSPAQLTLGRTDKSANALPDSLSGTKKRDASGKEVVFDYDDLLEFAGGKIANVFGRDFAVVDSYERVVRLPLDPYLLVHRVTELDATPRKMKPARIVTEYDIPTNAWHTTDGQIPVAVAIESGQCDLLLISYLGIDFENRGERVYRLLDCTMTFLQNMPREGDTLRYEIHIDSFARHGDSLLFFFHYECFVGEQMVLRMDGGCAGFFTRAELDGGKGVIRTEKELAERRNLTPTSFSPLLKCTKTQFTRSDLLALVQGDHEACFGLSHRQNAKNPSLKLATEQLLMSDRITHVDPQGGDWGLGFVISEKDMAPEHWYFPCHFKNDPVLAGSLMAEGGAQLLQFFMLYLGLQTQTRDARFQPVLGLPQVVRCRGQVTPADTRMQFRLEVKEVGLTPEPYMIGNIDVIVDDRIVVDFRDVGMRLVEKHENSKIAFDEGAIHEFAIGDVSKCFGPAYEPWRERMVQRNPNGALQLLTRVREVQGQRYDFTKPASLIAEYDVPATAWFLHPNATSPMPYSVLMEIALQPCGFLGAWMGSYHQLPEHDLHFRNLDGNARVLACPQVAGKTIETHVTLEKMTLSGSTLIERFRFALWCEGLKFYEGITVFGYFTADALAQQNRAPTQAAPLVLPDPTLITNLPTGQLGLLNQVEVQAPSEQLPLGAVIGRQSISPDQWYFPLHFHQDPVMPGSLGVEAALQAMKTYAEAQQLTSRFAQPQFVWAQDEALIWQYRGQILPDTREMHVQVVFEEIREEESRSVLVGSGSLWKDGKPIYTLERLVLALAATA
jgi:3-oxoacyl-(acyl-carrier-protein) synthase/3-hydroxymyristoyl/3-hydroxydecanoyl-(acyl carrier protein) dehydratase